MKTKLESLQVFRGIAALAVVLHHAFNSTSAFVAGTSNQFARAFEGGALGVDFFFVLSGFIIMHAHSNDSRSLLSVRRYLFKRLIRVFPAYLPISVLMIGLYTLLPGLSASGGREYSLLSSLLLLPADKPPALSVAWTLIHEILFYLFFLTYFLSKRFMLCSLFFWGGAIVTASLLQVDVVGWYRYPFSIVNLDFMVGVVAALLFQRNFLSLRPLLLLILGGGVAVFGIMMIIGFDEKNFRIVFAFGLSILMLGSVYAERKFFLAFPRFMLFVGNASYAIYLVHNPLLSIIQRLAGRFDLNWVVALFFGVLISVLVGCLYHLSFEGPVIKYLNGHLAHKN